MPCQGAAGFLSDLEVSVLSFRPILAMKYDELLWFGCGYFFDDCDCLILCAASSNESVGVSYQLAGEDRIHRRTGQDK